MEQIKLGHFKIVISTGQFFGEGIDADTLECLFIVYLRLQHKFVECLLQPMFPPVDPIHFYS